MEIDTTIFTQGLPIVLAGIIQLHKPCVWFLLIGAIVWLKWGVASNPETFALARVEAKINTLLSMTNLPGISMTFVTNRETNDQIYFKNC